MVTIGCISRLHWRQIALFVQLMLFPRARFIAEQNERISKLNFWQKKKK